MIMVKLPKINEDEIPPLPLSEMQEFRKKINELIKKHNLIQTKSERLQILGEIRAEAKRLAYSYPANLFAASTAYQAITENLFKSLKSAYQEAGRNTLVESREKDSTLDRIIANMEPDKANKFFGYFLKEELAQLGSLYEAQDNCPEAINFRKFISEHELEVISKGNSLNFKITNTHSAQVNVLKIESRKIGPKSTMATLSDKIPQHISPVNAERQVFGVQDGQKVCRTLIATKYFSNGDLLTHAKKNINKTPDNRARDAGHLFEQMATVLLAIKTANGIFPDAKLTNWLIDEKNQLQIADTKSFCLTDEQGQCSRYLNNNAGLFRTNGFKPKEFTDYDKGLSIASDPVHAFMLGKNLYCYLTGGLVDSEDAKNFQFNNKVYQTPLGKNFTTLIKSLVKPEPKDRLSVSEALEELKHINRLFAISSNKNSDKLIKVINALESLKRWNDPKKIDDLIKEKVGLIHQDSNKKDDIITSLNETVISLKKEEPLYHKLRQLSLMRQGSKPDVKMKNYLDTLSISFNQIPIQEKIAKLNSLHTLFNDSKKPSELFLSLGDLTIGGKDNKMTLFINTKKNELLETDVEQRPQMLHALNQTVTSLNNAQPTIAAVQNIIKQLRDKAGLFTIGYNKKADRIESALLAMSLEDRENPLSSSSFKNVLKELASHRLFGSKEPSKKNGDIDEAKAAQSFKTFKTKLANQMASEKPHPTNKPTTGPKKH